MPELPDIEVYLDSLRTRIEGRTLQHIRLKNPFLLRTAVPPIDTALGKRVVGLRRIGKRIVIEVEGNLFLVLHLMIAGRLQWRDIGAPRDRAIRWLSSSSTAVIFSSPKPAASDARRCMSSTAKKTSTRSIRAAST